MSELRAVLSEMRAELRRHAAELGGLSAQRMTALSTWRRAPADVRFLLLRFADHEEEHAMQAAGLLADAGVRPTTAQRILGAAERTRGELLGALVGLTDDDLDLTPPGEWSLRAILAHIINVERRYTIITRYSVDRFLAGQATYERPDDSIYPPEHTLEGMSLAEVVRLLDETREQALGQLAGLPDDVLAAPTIWDNRDVDVNFRLLRFSHHEREHTAHARKWRRQVEREPSEAQQLLALAWQERGDLQALLVGAGDDLLDLEDGGELTLRRLLRHISDAQAYLAGQIAKAG